jgi:hypothetical protein
VVNQAQLVARVRFVDGQHERKTGTYRVKDATILVTIDGAAKPKEIQFWTDGDYLIARDKAYDATVRLAPGKMEDETWFWWARQPLPPQAKRPRQGVP